MKKLSLFLTGVLAVVILSFSFPPIHLVGHWRVYHPSGARSFVDFKSDGTYMGTTTGGKVYVSGKYTSEDDVATITDGICGVGYLAKYKIAFVGKDSIVITAIEDSCSGRKASVDGATMRRVSKITKVSEN